MFFAKLILHLLVLFVLLADVRSKLVISSPKGKLGLIYDMKFDDEVTVEDEAFSRIWNATYQINARKPEQEQQLWIKISKNETGDRIIHNEFKSYEKLEAVAELGDTLSSKAEEAGIQQVYCIGTVQSESNTHIHGRVAIVMKPRGINLRNYCEKCGGIAGVEWLRISAEMMRALHFAHLKRVIHGNITPDNFVFAVEETVDSLGFRSTKLYLLGFGYSQLEHLVPSVTEFATVQFMSVNAHEIIESNASGKSNPQDIPPLTANDDIESCAYSMYYTKHPTLPWEDDSLSFYSLENITAEEAKSEADDRHAQKILLLNQIKEEKNNFTETVHQFAVDSHRASKGKSEFSYVGSVFDKMMYYARLKPHQVRIFPEENLVKQWQTAFLTMRTDTNKEKINNLAAHLSPTDLRQNLEAAGKAKTTPQSPVKNDGTSQSLDTTSGSTQQAAKGKFEMFFCGGRGKN